MISKVYAYLGKNQAMIDIPTGPKGSVMVEFTGGNIKDETNYSMATTKPIHDPGVQAVIENSPLYNHSIILVSQTENKDESVAAKMKEYEDVTNFAEAVALLKSEYQAKASQLKSPTSVKELAASLNISFPNWV